MANSVQVTHTLAGSRAEVIVDAGSHGRRRLEVDRNTFFDWNALDAQVRTAVEEMQRETRQHSGDQSITLGEISYSKDLQRVNDVLGVGEGDAFTRDAARGAAFGTEQGIVMSAGPVSVLMTDPGETPAPEVEKSTAKAKGAAPDTPSGGLSDGNEGKTPDATSKTGDPTAKADAKTTAAKADAKVSNKPQTA